MCLWCVSKIIGLPILIWVFLFLPSHLYKVMDFKKSIISSFENVLFCTTSIYTPPLLKWRCSLLSLPFSQLHLLHQLNKMLVLQCYVTKMKIPVVLINMRECLIFLKVFLFFSNSILWMHTVSKQVMEFHSKNLEM